MLGNAKEGMFILESNSRTLGKALIPDGMLSYGNAITLIMLLPPIGLILWLFLVFVLVKLLKGEINCSCQSYCDDTPSNFPNKKNVSSL